MIFRISPREKNTFSLSIFTADWVSWVTIGDIWQKSNLTMHKQYWLIFQYSSSGLNIHLRLKLSWCCLVSRFQNWTLKNNNINNIHTVHIYANDKKLEFKGENISSMCRSFTHLPLLGLIVFSHERIRNFHGRSSSSAGERNFRDDSQMKV